jgi:histidine triad (HIT) family protein
MASIFTRILRGEIPCHRVYEDEKHFAFLDIRPVQRGHTLVVPRREVSYLFDMPPEDLADLWKASQVVARALQAATGCKRIVTTVIGYEVPHVHVHLIPTNRAGDFPIPPQGSVDPVDAENLVAAVRRCL